MSTLKLEVPHHHPRLCHFGQMLGSDQNTLISHDQIHTDMGPDTCKLKYSHTTTKPAVLYFVKILGSNHNTMIIYDQSNPSPIMNTLSGAPILYGPYLKHL